MFGGGGISISVGSMDVSSDCSSLGLRSVVCSTFVKVVGKSCGLKLWVKVDCIVVEVVWCR